MTRLSTIVIMATAICLLQACNGSENSADTDTVNVVPVNAIVPPEKEDVQFMTTAGQLRIAETELGKMAQQKGRDLKIKNFGVMLLKDLAKADKRLAIMAKAKRIVLPLTTDTAYQKTIDSLSKVPSAQFDKAYINTMIARHQNDLKIFDAASKHCFDPDIKKLAAKALPRIKNHLAAINEVKEMAGGRD